jgi:tetratricopeptide (TPR) repeat protein
MAFHQRHKLGSVYSDNQIVFRERLASSPVNQDIHNPEKTDAQLVYQQKNDRTLPRELRETRNDSPYNKARVLEEMGLHQKAVEEYDRLQNESIVERAKFQVNVWLLHDKAKALSNLCNEKRKDEAIYLIAKAIEMDSNNTWLYSAAAGIYARFNDYDQAKQYYKLALEKDPNNFEAANILDSTSAESIKDRGNLANQRGSKLAAMKLFETALCKSNISEQPWALFDKASVLLEMGKFDLALSSFAKVYSHLRRESQTWIDSKTGRIAEYTGNTNLAKILYTNALQKNPNNFEARDALNRLNSL